jgi:hypothetical protein
MVYGFALSVGTTALITALAFATSAYAIELRYLMPTVPALVIAVAALIAHDSHRFASPSRKWLGGAVAASLVALTLMNLGVWRAALASHHDVASLRKILDTELPNGMNAVSMLARAADTDAPLMSNQSQQLHLALRKPTLGVPERRLSERRWSDDDLHRLAQRFDVRYIVVFTRRPLGGAHGRNDYIWQLARERPDWARHVLSTPDLEVLAVLPPRNLRKIAR